MDKEIYDKLGIHYKIAKMLKQEKLDAEDKKTIYTAYIMLINKYAKLVCIIEKLAEESHNF